MFQHSCRALFLLFVLGIGPASSSAGMILFNPGGHISHTDATSSLARDNLTNYSYLGSSTNNVMGRSSQRFSLTHAHQSATESHTTYTQVTDVSALADTLGSFGEAENLFYFTPKMNLNLNLATTGVRGQFMAEIVDVTHNRVIAGGLTSSNVNYFETLKAGIIYEVIIKAKADSRTRTSGGTATLTLSEASTVPEPSSVVLMGLGGLALVAYRRRRAARRSSRPFI